jgi:hypothetical protein
MAVIVILIIGTPGPLVRKVVANNNESGLFGDVRDHFLEGAG